jgi:hypothetical protein
VNQLLVADEDYFKVRPAPETQRPNRTRDLG